MKIRPLIGRCIRIGRRLHVNEPKHACHYSAKPPETSNSVQERIRFLQEAQVDMSFIIEIMPNF